MALLQVAARKAGGDDPIGNNDMYLEEVAQICDDVIVAWGNFKEAEERINQVLPLFPNALCFGLNQNRTPAHPLAMMYQGKTNSPKLSEYRALANCG